MYRFFLAIRYLWSRPISWISMVGIWLSVMATIAVIAVMTGFLTETRRMIRGTTSDLILTPQPSVRDGQILAPPDYESVRAAVAGVSGVEALSRHLLRPAMLRVEHISPDIMGDSQYTQRNFAKIIGLDPANEATDFNEYVRSETDPMLAVDDPAQPFALSLGLAPPWAVAQRLPVALVGSQLFRWYELRKGQVITLLTLPEELDADQVEPLSQRFVVGGAVKTGHHEHDAKAIYVALADLERLEQQSATDTSEICVVATPGADLEDLKSRVMTRLDEMGLAATVETWMDKHSSYLGAVENERAVLGVLLFFFVAVACFNVFATLTVMVNDKIKDIGVLNALGATARGILTIFVGCGLLMTLFSSAIGCVSGVLVAQNINALNQLVQRVMGVGMFVGDGYAFEGLPVVLEPSLIVLVFAATLVFAVLCSLVPAARAARMDPVQALRHE